MSRKSKIIAVVVALVVVICAVAGVIYQEFFTVKPIEVKETIAISQAQTEDVSDVKLIAHRGLSAIAPENTMASVKAACDAGYFGVEFDIRLTSDGEWVVHHDADLSRMAGVKSKIAEMTLKEVQAVEFNNGANIDKYDGVTVPTLREVLDYVSTTDTIPVIEIKTETKDGIDDLVAMLKEYNYLETARIISFYEEPLKEYKRICNRTPVSFLVHEINDEVIAVCTENDFEAISFNYKNVKQKDIQKAVDAKLVLQTWTVDSVESLEEFYSYGVEYFTTNCIIPDNQTQE